MSHDCVTVVTAGNWSSTRAGILHVCISVVTVATHLVYGHRFPMFVFRWGFSLWKWFQLQSWNQRVSPLKMVLNHETTQTQSEIRQTQWYCDHFDFTHDSSLLCLWCWRKLWRRCPADQPSTTECRLRLYWRSIRNWYQVFPAQPCEAINNEAL